MANVIYSMTVSVDGFVTDRSGGLEWSVPDKELFRFHLARTKELAGHLQGRRLYEAMLVWETDPAFRETELEAEFADVWTALPKVVLSRTLERVEGSSRLARASLEEELAAFDGDVGIGGAELAAAAIERDLVDELHVFRYPIVLGGGTPYLPPLPEPLRLDRVGTTEFGSGVVLERYRRVR